jgi:hypothetical protein
MSTIPLCVSYEKKDDAKRAGARWDNENRVWTCTLDQLNTDAYLKLKPFVPRMYRPDVKPPIIRPWMVPQSLWGKNLRAILPKEQWDIVRRHAYAQAGYRCRVCGEKGLQWPVEADEAWEYNDESLTHTLKGVIALCPSCHHVRHWGLTMINGFEAETTTHIMKINGWTSKQVNESVEVAFREWERRSGLQWTSDYSWVTRIHGIEIPADAESRAEDANKAILLEADSRLHAEAAIPLEPAVRAAESGLWKKIKNLIRFI